MKPLRIKETPKTPVINFDNYSGVLEIRGNSIPENPKLFFKPLIEWVDQYIKQPSRSTTINITLEYFNTTSSKYIYEILKKFELIRATTTVNWIFETDDEDTLMAGEEYQALVKLKFNFVEDKIDANPFYLTSSQGN